MTPKKTFHIEKNCPKNVKNTWKIENYYRLSAIPELPRRGKLIITSKIFELPICVLCHSNYNFMEYKEVFLCYIDISDRLSCTLSFLKAKKIFRKKFFFGPF